MSVPMRIAANGSDLMPADRAGSAPIDRAAVPLTARRSVPMSNRNYAGGGRSRLFKDAMDSGQTLGVSPDPIVPGSGLKARNRTSRCRNRPRRPNAGN